MTDLAFPARGPTSEAAGAATPALYRAVWRWHFYAGLFVAPFLIVLATTGLIMLWVSAIDGREGEKGVPNVAIAGAAQPVSAQADAAITALPGGTLAQYISPLGPTRPALFRVDAGAASRMVAVDPYTNAVLVSWDRRAGWYDFASNIHGTLLIGTLGDRLIEIAAGFGIMLVVTGAYLWWPRGRGGFLRALIPTFSSRGRPLMKSLHATVGIYAALLLVMFLLSGLTWSGIWGEKFTQAWSTFPAAKYDEVPVSSDVHASMNHGAAKEIPWALEQTPMPMSGSHHGVHGVPTETPVDVDSVVTLAQKLGFGTDGRFQLNVPKGDTGIWTISRDSMSNDSTDPTADRTVHVDRHTGKILADIGFADYSVPARAVAAGIAFHEGDLGWWNVALNTAFCVSVIFLSVSGVVMWWLRRPAGQWRLSPPKLATDVPLVRGVALIMLLLAMIFPLAGLTLIVVLVLDLAVISRVPALRRALS